MLDSFEKAKIKYPTSEIYTSGGLFGTDDMLNPEAKDVEKCHPAKYCMTVEQFLSAGHKFVEGDIVSLGSRWNDTVTKSEVDSYNEPDEGDCLIYILRAAALDKPKRVKVEYVKCEDKQAWTLVKEFEEGVEFYTCSKGMHTSKNIGNLLSVWRDGDLHRRIETEITERDEFIMSVAVIGEDTGITNTGLERLAAMLYDSGKFKLVEE